ncbi:MAG: dehydrogenase, partial [Chloroflexi bacterium]|nr:dehydrogenase [Chloroflexota bacterium]
LMGATDRWIEKFRVVGDRAVGYDAQGAEIVRVPLKEPIIVRPAFDAQRAVYRHNIT